MGIPSFFHTEPLPPLRGQGLLTLWQCGCPVQGPPFALQVNYVGKGGNLYTDAGYKLSGSAYVIEKYLGNTWLWDRVRVSGGAYGGFCSFDPQSGAFNFLSYRCGRRGGRGGTEDRTRLSRC